MITTAFGEKVLRALGGMANSGSVPVGYKMGLSSTEPTIAGTGYTEPADSNYARISFYYSGDSTSSGPSFPFEFVPDSGNKAIRNKYEIHFNVATVDWTSPITYILLFANDGTLLAYAPLTNAITVLTGYIPTIAKHAAVIGIDA